MNREVFAIIPTTKIVLNFEFNSEGSFLYDIHSSFLDRVQKLIANSQCSSQLNKASIESESYNCVACLLNY